MINVFDRSQKYNVIFNYLLYTVLVFIVHVSLLSFVAFFHFLLDHSLRSVEDWVFRNSWELLAASKFFSFVVSIKCLNVNRAVDKSFFDYLKLDIHVPRKFTLVVLIFQSIVFLYFGQYSYNSNSWTHLDFQLVGYLGVLIYFLCDVLLIGFCLYDDSSSLVAKRFSLLAMFTIFLVATFLLIPYATSSLLIIGLNMALCLLLLYLRNFGWLVSALLIVLYISPLLTFFGFNPVWLSKYSFFKAEQPITISTLITCYLTSFVYLSYSYRHRDR